MAQQKDKMHSLQRGLDRWDHAWSSKDTSVLENILSKDATLHADGILFNKDVKGADKIINVHKRYFTHYDYKHELNACAFNPDTNAAFGLWTDYGVHRKEAGPEASGGLPGTTLCGTWKVIFDSKADKVTDIYFLRQLHAEEAEHRLKDPKSIARGGDIDPTLFKCSTADAAPEKLAAARRAADEYSKIWHTGDVSIADKIMEENVVSVDLMHGGQLRGREAFKDMIKKMYQGWHPDQSDIDVGVSSDGSVAMVHWTTKGKVKKEGKEETVSCYGLNALAIGDDGKIRQSAGFRQFFPEEREKVMKPDAFIHAPHEQ